MRGMPRGSYGSIKDMLEKCQTPPLCLQWTGTVAGARGREARATGLSHGPAARILSWFVNWLEENDLCRHQNVYEPGKVDRH